MSTTRIVGLSLIVAAMTIVVALRLYAASEYTLTFEQPDRWNTGKSMPLTSVSHYELWRFDDKKAELTDRILPYAGARIMSVKVRSGCYLMFTVHLSGVRSDPSDFDCSPDKKRLEVDIRRLIKTIREGARRGESSMMVPVDTVSI